jgi:Domain of unknown function (DUF5668)
MNTWLLIRRLRGPAFLLLVGITALLNQWDVLSFGRSWPLYLILFGVMSLAERAALSQAQMDAFDPITGQPRPPDATVYGGPGQSTVPASPSIAPGPDAGAGRS